MARNDGWWIELDSAGVRQILNSPEVAGMVKRAAQNAAKAARANVPKGASVQVHSGQTRSGVRSSAIVTVPAKTEANHGVLAKAIGAAKI